MEAPDPKPLLPSEADAYIRSLFDCVPDGILIADGDSRYLDANATMCAMLGYRRDELIGMYARDIVVPSEFTHIQPALDSVKASETHRRQWRLRRKDASTLVAEVSAVMLPDGSFLTMVRDIGERLLAEAKIQRLTQLYATLSQCNQAIVRCRSAAELFPVICRDAVEFGGMKLAWIGMLDAASQRLEPVAAYGDGAGRVHQLAASADAGEPCRCPPAAIALRSGQPFWCQNLVDEPANPAWQAFAIEAGWRGLAVLPLCSGGEVVGSLNLCTETVGAFDDEIRSLLIKMASDIGFALDNFARDAARRQADDERRKFETIVEHAGWGMAIADPQSHVMIYVNPAFARMHGYFREEMLGMSLADTFAPEDRSELAPRARAVHQKGRLIYESTHARKDGSTFPCLTDVTAYKDDEGQVLFRAATFEDISERRRVEEEIHQLTCHLEQRVVERTAELEAANRELEAANRELEAFSYSVSHDLKAPLRGIDGYSHLLEEAWRGRGNDEEVGFLRSIRQGVAQMQQLIDDLLAYSRLARRRLDVTAVDLSTLVANICAEYAQDFAEHGIILHSSVPSIDVRGDRGALATVLRNLVDNAVKFSRHARSPAIEIGAGRDAATVTLFVRDNGIGFDMRFSQRIFAMFSRLQRAEDYPGSGVGLALVSKAVQRMGGRVWAESQPGQGATFFVEIPAS